MFDLMAVAFQTDSTRIATFLMGREGSNRTYRSIGVPEAHHGISHHMGSVEKIDKLAKINRLHIELFASFLEKTWNPSRTATATLLDHTLIVYGSGLSDGNSHLHHDLPVVIAGRRAASRPPWSLSATAPSLQRRRSYACAVDLDLVFLGTSASMPTAQRAPAALLLRRGGERLLFDCAEGTAAAASALVRRPPGPRGDLPHAPPRRPLPRAAGDAEDVRAPRPGRARADGLRPERGEGSVRGACVRSSAGCRTR